MAEKRKFSNKSTSSINEEEDEISGQQYKDLKKKILFQRAGHRVNKRMKEKFSSSSKIKEPINKDSDPLSPEECYLSPPHFTTTAWEEWSKENPSGNSSSTQVKNRPPVNPPSGKEPIIKAPGMKHTPLEASTATTKIMKQSEVKDRVRHNINVVLT